MKRALFVAWIPLLGVACATQLPTYRFAPRPLEVSLTETEDADPLGRALISPNSTGRFPASRRRTRSGSRETTRRIW